MQYRETVMELKSLNELIPNIMEKHAVKCSSYALINNFSLLSSGVISTVTEINSSQQFLFQGCSFSKIFTSLAVLQLASQGHIQLDRTINEQLHSWKIPESSFSLATVRQCLEMTSGLNYGPEGSTCAGYLQGEPVPSLQEILQGNGHAKNKGIQAVREPGVRYAYSGAGYMIIQKLIEDVTGQSFSDYVGSTIFAPLEMRNSHFQCPLDERFKQQVVPGYNHNNEQITDGWENIPTTASGGIWTTSEDLSKLLIAISKSSIDDGFFSKKIVNELFTYNQFGYGLGLKPEGQGSEFNIRKNGHNSAYHNEAILFPYLGTGLIIMTNKGSAMPFIQEIIQIVSQKNQWPKHTLYLDEVHLENTTNTTATISIRK